MTPKYNSIEEALEDNTLSYEDLFFIKHEFSSTTTSKKFCLERYKSNRNTFNAEYYPLLGRLPTDEEYLKYCENIDLQNEKIRQDYVSKMSNM